MKEIDSQLYTRLSQYTHLIFKGDLNYRKLVNDINWPPNTAFKTALKGFLPCPLLALRTLKADTIAGLETGVAERVSSKSPDWLVSGEFGIIMHAS